MSGPKSGPKTPKGSTLHTYREFACTPLRNGWVQAWQLDNITTLQDPELRMRRGSEVCVLSDSSAVVALVRIDDDNRPGLMPMELVAR